MERLQPAAPSVDKWITMDTLGCGSLAVPAKGLSHAPYSVDMVLLFAGGADFFSPSATVKKNNKCRVVAERTVRLSVEVSEEREQREKETAPLDEATRQGGCDADAGGGLARLVGRLR